ncbi:MAG: hypothetical protein KGD64_01405 [Candidatus Heimdallarchaeota archaeon]|nr:hypothetical protein [Candidatus Heimdallarchaeota archaeon]
MSRRIDYICLLDLTDNFLSKISENAALIEEHWNFLRILKKDKQLTLAGTSLDAFYEIIILSSKNEKEALEIIMRDPLIQKEVLDYSVCPIRSSLVTSAQIKQHLEEKDATIETVYTLENTDQYFSTITGRPTFINDLTEEEGKIMGNHFQYLKKRYDEKKLIFAGPILCEDKFGVTIFLASDYDEALYYVNNDPSVKAKLMKPGLHPFRVLLMGNS